MPTKKPTGAVASLAIKRGTGGAHTAVASWKVPSELVKASSATQATKLIVAFSLGIAGKDPTDSDTINKTTVKTRTANLNSFDAGKKTYTRSSFYPLTSKKLAYVTVKVRAANKYGSSDKVASATLKFKKPRKPAIAAMELNTSTGVVSTTITTNAGADLYERYDTEYYWTVTKSDGTVLHDVHTSSTNTTINLSYDATGYQSLPYDSYIRFRCRARARGYAGASAWVERNYYLAFPKRPTIESIDVPDKASSERVTVHINTNATTEHPVTVAQLEVLKDVTYATVAEIEAASVTWTEVGAPDNGACTALACTVSDVLPSAGKHSWVRVRCWYEVEAALHRESVPMEVTALHTEAATITNDSVVILSATPGDDGTSAVVQLAWAPTGTTDTSDGTELSWSDQLDTWRSTEEPSTFEVTYDDGSVSEGGTTYASSATITIKGLDEGQTTYVRARRYKETDSGTTFGPYGNTAIIVPTVAPESVVLTAPAYVAEGDGIPFEWTFSGGSTQAAWQLVLSSGTILAEGTDAVGSCVLDAERAASMASLGSLNASVRVSTGGGWVASNSVTVRIVAAPTLSITVPSSLTAQPLAFTASCDVDAQLVCVVKAQGVSGDTPAGMMLQPEGDTIWSDVLLPEWSSGTATITLPPGLDFIDGAGYDVTVTAIDPDTGLQSATATADTTVAWTHQAPDPSGCVTLTPISTVDAEGYRTQAVRITLTPPVGSVASDCYDVYRCTQDGPQLVAQTYPLTVEVVDYFAPYGDGMVLYYRIACRTQDGDVDWADVPYILDGDGIRVDWSDRSVWLPYNPAITDGYAKDVDVHTYLDGSVDAYYNQGIKRTAKLTTDVMRLTDPATMEGVRALAHHVGPAFVRTPDGSAYEADVQVTELAPTREVAAVTISATEVRLTPAYMLPAYNVTDETTTTTTGA